MGDEFIFYFVFLNQWLRLTINSWVPTQLSLSVNESLSEVAVRDSSAGAKGQKHAAKWLSVPKETPYESWKKQLFCYFFSASVKKVREEIILVLYFLFWHCPKKNACPTAGGKQKKSSAGKIKLPTFSLLLKFPKLIVVPPPQTAGNLNATASCGSPDQSFNARGSWDGKLFFTSLRKNY